VALIVALRLLLTDADVPFCGDSEFRVQLSSSQASCGFAAVLFTSGVVAVMRGDEPKSEPREKLEFSREAPFWPLPNEGPPELLLLLFALASHLAAQSSVFETDDDCGAEFAEEPKPGWAPRYESVVNDGPSAGIVLSGVNGFVEDGIEGVKSGGAATALPMLDQLLPSCGEDGVASTLRSTGMAGSDELFQAGAVDAGAVAGAVVTVGLVPQGGGAIPFREVELAAGVCDGVANGLFDCEG
jgi:hypothetical protein